MEDEERLPNIVVTGTPGVGKTSLSMLLVDKLNENVGKISPIPNKNFTYINLGKLINEKKLYDNWNEEYDVPEFNEDKVISELETMLTEGGLIMDFHSAYFLPEESTDLVVLLRCNNTVLYDRLKARNYSDKKIKENIECEIMEVTSEDVRENFREEVILELKNEEVDDMEKNIEQILYKLINK